MFHILESRDNMPRLGSYVVFGNRIVV